MNRRLTMLGLGVLAATLALLAGVRLYPSLAPDLGFASPDGDLTCSVKASCDVGEVAVFRMSGLANAHAQTADSHAVTYPQTVCCAWPAGLSTECNGHDATVLTLWAADNAHVAVDGSYPTQICLSAPETEAQCTYGDTCGPAYTCMATVLATNNAHIADCDGVDDYPTKVCCTACDWSVPAGDPDFDWLTNAEEDKNGDGTVDYDPDRLLTETDACVNDTDGDGCSEYEEWGDDRREGGLRHPGYNPASLPGSDIQGGQWDFFDVSVPAMPDMTANGPKNQAVAMDDVLAVLFYVGTYDGDGGSPNSNGVAYDSIKGSCDWNGDTVPDKEGVCYDRTPSVYPGQLWRSGPPDNAVAMDDVLVNLAQVGDSCIPEP